MNDHKPWDVDAQGEDSLNQPEEKRPQYEVIKAFSHGRKRVHPGDDLPKDISDAAMASLLRKGVLEEL